MIDSLYRDDVRESIIIFARESRFRVDRAKVYRINRKTDVIVRRVSLERTSGKVRASRFSRDEFSKTMARATDRYRRFYLFVLISLSLRSIKIIAIPYLATRDSLHPLSKFRNDLLFCMGFVIPGFVIPGFVWRERVIRNRRIDIWAFYARRVNETF